MKAALVKLTFRSSVFPARTKRNRLLLAATFLASFGVPTAWAQLVDPTAFHVSSPGATGSDPVLLNNNTTFTISDINNSSSQQIDAPLDVYILEPTTQAAPTVSSALFQGLAANSDTFTIKPEAQWNTVTANSFYKNYLNCGGGCDGSVNASNVAAAEGTVGLEGTLFNVYLVAVNMNGGAGFNSNSDFETLLGNFAQGSIIAPFATTPPQPNGTTAFDTSWTNAGFVNTVPETSTWVMMLGGFGLICALGWRKSRSPRFAL
jgi:hypothetical protein